MHLELDHAIHLSGTQIQTIASSLARRGWAEGNGGNLSLRLEDDFQPKGETILLAEDAPAFAQATVRLLTEPDLNRQLRANGRAWVEANYAWQTVYQRVNEVYARLLDPKQDRM